MLASMIGRTPGHLVTPAAPWLFELLAIERSGLVSYADIRRLVQSRMPTIWGSASAAYLRKGGRASQVSVADWFLGLVRIYAAARGEPEPATWVSHAPLASQFLVSAARIFTETVIIHIVRDGRAVYASLTEFRPQPVSSPRQVALLWRERLCFGLAAEHCDQLPGVVTLRYEDLVSDPEATLMSLRTDTGIDIPADAATRGAFTFPASTGHRLVGHPPDPARIDAWRSRLSARQIELFEYYSNELLQYFGYDPVYGTHARGPSPGEWASIHLRDFTHPLRYAAMKRLRTTDGLGVTRTSATA